MHGKNNMPFFSLLFNAWHVVFCRSFCKGKDHTQKVEKLRKKWVHWDFFFPELAGWRCLKETWIKDRSNLQLPSTSVPVFFIFHAFLLPVDFEFFIFFFFLLFVFLLVLTDTITIHVLRLWHLKQKLKHFFEYLGSFLMHRSFVFVWDVGT